MSRIGHRWLQEAIVVRWIVSGWRSEDWHSQVCVARRSGTFLCLDVKSKCPFSSNYYCANLLRTSQSTTLITEPRSKYFLNGITIDWKKFEIQSDCQSRNDRFALKNTVISVARKPARRSNLHPSSTQITKMSMFKFSIRKSSICNGQNWMIRWGTITLALITIRGQDLPHELRIGANLLIHIKCLTNHRPYAICSATMYLCPLEFLTRRRRLDIHPNV
jgi:hypothetical protein